MAGQEHRDLFNKWLALGRPAVVVEPEGTIGAADICDWVSDCDRKLPRRYRELVGLEPVTNYAEAARILRPAANAQSLGRPGPFETHPRKLAFELGWVYARIGELLVADMAEHYEAFVLGREAYQEEGLA